VIFHKIGSDRTPYRQSKENSRRSDSPLWSGQCIVEYDGQAAIEVSYGYGYADYVIDGDPTSYEPTLTTKGAIDLTTVTTTTTTTTTTAIAEWSLPLVVMAIALSVICILTRKSERLTHARFDKFSIWIVREVGFAHQFTSTYKPPFSSIIFESPRGYSNCWWSIPVMIFLNAEDRYSWRVRRLATVFLTSSISTISTILVRQSPINPNQQPFSWGFKLTFALGAYR
jgi:hypothetical protein